MLKKIKFILFAGLMIVGVCPVVNAQDVATDFFIEEPMVENVVEMQTDEVDSNDAPTCMRKKIRQRVNS